MIDLLVTKGKWYDLIATGKKKFDFRKGYREIREEDGVRFLEADENGKPTGNECFARVTLVVHSLDFPKHFGWTGDTFTIIQFEIGNKPYPPVHYDWEDYWADGFSAEQERKREIERLG